MLPIGPLMMEHRLIERMIVLMQQELTRIKDNVAVDPEFAFVDPVFIDTAVDFLSTYADRCHHGKEEDLLFAGLAPKPLAPEHRRLMEELASEHAWVRETTDRLLKAKENHLRGHQQALADLMRHLEELVQFYPRHIAKEEEHFFTSCLNYLSSAEKEEVLKSMADFDRQLIHEKYGRIVEQIENRGACRV